MTLKCRQAKVADDSYTEVLQNQWSAVVKEVISTGRTNLLLQLLRKVCCKDSTKKWSIKQLDDHAIHLFNALQAGAVSEVEDKDLLNLLIAGADPEVLFNHLNCTCKQLLI